MTDGAGAVAEGGFDRGAEFAEGAVVFDDFKEGIVAEAAGAGGFEANAAVTVAFGFGLDVSGWVGQGGVADVMGGAFFERQFAEFFQQQAVVGFVGGAGAGKRAE